jgi:hypothetical protein
MPSARLWGRRPKPLCPTSSPWKKWREQLFEQPESFLWMKIFLHKQLRITAQKVSWKQFHFACISSSVRLEQFSSEWELSLSYEFLSWECLFQCFGGTFWRNCFDFISPSSVDRSTYLRYLECLELAGNKKKGWRLSISAIQKLLPQLLGPELNRTSATQ